MLFGTWVTIVVITMSTGECLNCIYPRIEDTYNSEGLICSWEEDDFYKEKGEWILTELNSTDNCIEKKARDKYWKKRNQKKVIHTVKEKNNQSFLMVSIMVGGIMLILKKYQVATNIEVSNMDILIILFKSILIALPLWVLYIAFKIKLLEWWNGE